MKMVLDGLRIMRWREEDERMRGEEEEHCCFVCWGPAGFRQVSVFFCTSCATAAAGECVCVSVCACECVLIRFVEVQIRPFVHPSRCRERDELAA